MLCIIILVLKVICCCVMCLSFFVWIGRLCGGW